MVGAGNGDALDAPEQPGRGVAPHDDVIAGVIGRGDPGKVAREAGHIIAATGVTRHLLQREGAGAHLGQLIDRQVLVGLGGNDHLLQVLDRFFQCDAEDDLLARGDEHIGQGDGLVTDVLDDECLPTQRHPFQTKAPFRVGGGAEERITARENDRGTRQAIIGSGIFDGSFDGLGLFLRAERQHCKEGE